MRYPYIEAWHHFLNDVLGISPPLSDEDLESVLAQAKETSAPPTAVHRALPEEEKKWITLEDLVRMNEGNPSPDSLIAFLEFAVPYLQRGEVLGIFQPDYSNQREKGLYYQYYKYFQEKPPEMVFSEHFAQGEVFYLDPEEMTSPENEVWISDYLPHTPN